MSSFATSCPWCGRSLMLSALTQVLGLVAVVVAVLVATGTTSWDEIRTVLHVGGGPVGEAPSITGSVVQPGAPGTGATSPRPGGLRSAAPRRDRPAAGRETRPRERRETAATGCAGGTRARTIRRRHPEWEEWVVRAAGCGEVAVGFDAEQVRTVLGEPDSVVAEGTGEAWIYGARRVVLRAGRVAAVTP